MFTLTTKEIIKDDENYDENDSYTSHMPSSTFMLWINANNIQQVLFDDEVTNEVRGMDKDGIVYYAYMTIEDTPFDIYKLRHIFEKHMKLKESMNNA